MSTATLKPGLLVSLRTSLAGGVQYTRVDIDKGTVEGEAKRAKWETTKVIEDEKEYDRAGKARSRAGALIRAVCVPSAFGLVCPEAREAELDTAIVKARAIADAHNADENTRTTRVGVWVLKGRIAQTDDEAARAISSEITQLLNTMQEGISEGDVKKIREAAVDAKKMGAMFDAESAAKVSAAVDEARAAAKEIAKRLTAKESIAETVQIARYTAINTARFSFLDDSESAEMKTVPSTKARMLDVESDKEIETAVQASFDKASEESNRDMKRGEQPNDSYPEIEA